jgi:hypothetical protein
MAEKWIVLVSNGLAAETQLMNIPCGYLSLDWI